MVQNLRVDLILKVIFRLRIGTFRFTVPANFFISTPLSTFIIYYLISSFSFRHCSWEFRDARTFEIAVLDAEGTLGMQFGEVSLLRKENELLR
jgi:hypothetical protein